MFRELQELIPEINNATNVVIISLFETKKIKDEFEFFCFYKKSLYFCISKLQMIFKM